MEVEELRTTVQETEKEFEEYLNNRLANDFGIVTVDTNMSVNDKVKYILENEHDIVLNKTTEELEKEYNNNLEALRRLAGIAEDMVKNKEKAIKNLNKKIDSLNNKIEKREEEQEALEEEISALDSSIDSLNEQQKELDEESKKLEEIEASKKDEKSQIEAEISNISEEIKNLELKTERSEEENKELENLKGELNDKENSKKGLDDELSNLNTKKGEISASQKSNNKKLNNLKDRKNKKAAYLLTVKSKIKYDKDKLGEATKKCDEEQKLLAKQKTELSEIFAKKNITLSFSSEPTKDEKKAETSKGEKEAGGKVVAGGGNTIQPQTNLPTLSNEQAVKNMYENLKELDPNTRMEVLSKMGRADVDAMLKYTMWHPLKRAELKRLVGATKKDMLKDPNKREKIMEIMQNKFGLDDAADFIVNDFSKLGQKDLAELRAKIDDFNKNKATYSREEQILFDEFAKMVSLNSLESQIQNSGPVGRVKGFFVKDQARTDINLLFDTISKSRSEYGKEAKTSQFYQDIIGKTNHPQEISKSEISVTRNDHIASRIADANVRNNGQTR